MTFVDSNIQSIQFSIIQGNTSTLTYKYAHNTTTKHSSRFQYPHSSPFIVVLGTLSIASRIIVLLFLYVFVLSPSTELCVVVVCCCHCWFMRQLWRRISLLSLRQGFVVLLFLSSTYISAENTNQRLCHLIDIKDNHNKTSKEMINALLIKFD